MSKAPTRLMGVNRVGRIRRKGRCMQYTPSLTSTYTQLHQNDLFCSAQSLILCCVPLGFDGLINFSSVFSLEIKSLFNMYGLFLITLYPSSLLIFLKQLNL